MIIFSLFFHRNEAEKGGATKLERNKVENAQEPAGLSVNKEQPHSHQVIEEQGHETDPILDTDGVTSIVENLDTINGTRIMDYQDLKEPESGILDK